MKAHFLPTLATPAAAEAGCYVNTTAGWQSTPCAAEGETERTFGRPEFPLALTVNPATKAAPTPPLVFGQVQVSFAKVGAESNVPAGVGGDAGSGTPNEWSIQNNSDYFLGSNGDTDWVQFTIQSNGSTSNLCIWNIDVTKQLYSNTCKSVPQRAGGLIASDAATIAGYVNSATKQLTMLVQLTWVGSGQATQYQVVANDQYDFAANWSQVSGGVMGMGTSSGSVFTNAEVWTTVTVSSCVGDTTPTSPTCSATPTLSPNVKANVSTGSGEWNNLEHVAAGSVSYPNTDLAVSNYIETTTGSCLTSACTATETPNCTWTYDCQTEPLPGGPVGSVENVESVLASCSRTPTSVVEVVNGAPTALSPVILGTNQEAYGLGTQSQAGVVTSGPPIGTVAGIQACTTTNGVTQCDPSANVTIADCCTPKTCTFEVGMCGVQSDGCGGTISCGGCSGADTCNSSGFCSCPTACPTGYTQGANCTCTKKPVLPCQKCGKVCC